MAASGINAVAVIDAKNLKTLGYIPAGWFPAKVQVSPDGKKLIIANAKGFGSGPNGGSTFTMGPEGSYIGSLMKGTVQILDIPSDKELKKLTQQVISNNFSFDKASSEKFTWRKTNPVPLYPGQRKVPSATLFSFPRKTGLMMRSMDSLRRATVNLLWPDMVKVFHLQTGTGPIRSRMPM